MACSGGLDWFLSEPFLIKAENGPKTQRRFLLFVATETQSGRRHRWAADSHYGGTRVTHANVRRPRRPALRLHRRYPRVPLISVATSCVARSSQTGMMLPLGGGLIKKWFAYVCGWKPPEVQHGSERHSVGSVPP